MTAASDAPSDDDQQDTADVLVEIRDGSDDLLDIEPDSETIATTYDITSYGVDYDVTGIIRRMDIGDIVVPSFDPDNPGLDVGAFQRGFVWRRNQMSRFIESLLLGLPVPGIFLVKDRDQRLLVLDGQQRLRTLHSYYEGTLGGRPFRLTGVQEPFAGLTYAHLAPEDRRRLDDGIIHATVLRDESESQSQNAVYSIYERLNTGGSPLQPQEIRIALFPGSYLRGLTEINKSTAWRDLYGPKSARFRDHELILRILALNDWQDRYRKPLKSFLNDYLGAHRDDALSAAEGAGKTFLEAAAIIDSQLGPSALRPERALNVAITEAVFVGVMRRLESGIPLGEGELPAAHEALMENRAFQTAVTSRTSDEDNVDARLDAATDAFA